MWHIDSSGTFTAFFTTVVLHAAVVGFVHLSFSFCLLKLFSWLKNFDKLTVTTQLNPRKQGRNDDVK